MGIWFKIKCKHRAHEKFDPPFFFFFFISEYVEISKQVFDEFKGEKKNEPVGTKGTQNECHHLKLKWEGWICDMCLETSSHDNEFVTNSFTLQVYRVLQK